MIFKFSSIFQPENRTGFQEVGNDKNSTKGTEDEIHDPKTLRVCYRKNRDEMEIGKQRSSRIKQWERTDKEANPLEEITAFFPQGDANLCHLVLTEWRNLKHVIKGETP